MIVEPGAYQTPVFGNIVMAADQERTETYGVSNGILEKVSGVFGKSAGNPQEVADAILQIVETQAGQRKLRYRVSAASLGLDEINALSERVQSGLLSAFGLAEDVAFVQRSAAGAD